MAPPEPLRGEVWDVRFGGQGLHPAVVLSVNAVNARLHRYAVVPVTGTPGPAHPHVTLTTDTGLTRYDQSYADVTGLQPVPRARLDRRRGLLAGSELAVLEARLRTYLGL